MNSPEKLNPNVGVDIGGSHAVSAIIVDGQVVQESVIRAMINSAAEADLILGTWINMLETSLQKTTGNNQLIGIAMPGPFDYINGISLITGMQKYESLYGLNIKEILANKLTIPKSNIQFFNDAKCFMVGEMIYGAGKGYKRAIGITLGTGVGSAVFAEGIVEDVNRGSSAFLEGIVEEYLSTRWFITRFMELSGTAVADVRTLCEVEGQQAIVTQIFQEFSVNLSDFLTEFIAAERPEIVIIGGNITKAANRFFPLLKHTLAARFPSVIIEQTLLWENASLIGASYLANKMESVPTISKIK